MTRNAELLREVADTIEAKPHRWRQSDFVTAVKDCGTAHCIGGWAAVCSNLNPDPLTSDEMGDLLGLERDEWDYVFFNGMGHRSHPNAEKEVADWLRAIAMGADVVETAPDWWEA